MDCLPTQDPDTIPESTHTPCFALLTVFKLGLHQNQFSLNG